MTVTPSPSLGVLEEVNSPAHYVSHPSGIECIELLRGREHRLACVIKYMWRDAAKHTTPEVDVRKANWYLRDYRYSPCSPLVNEEKGSLNYKRRVVAECRFRDWVNHPDSIPRPEDRVILAVVDHDHDRAVDLLTALLRGITAA